MTKTNMDLIELLAKHDQGAYCAVSPRLSHRHTAFGLSQDRPSRQIALQSPAGQWMICASVYLLVFIRVLLVHHAEKILLSQPLTLEGGLPPT